MCIEDLQNCKVGFIGCGSMGGALIRAMARQIPAQNIIISAAHPEHAQELAAATGCKAARYNSEVAKEADYLFIAVKPAVFGEVVNGLSFKRDAVVISMAAGIPLYKLRNFNRSVVRIMPNMPAAVGQAMTAMCHESVSTDKIESVKTLLETAGKVEIVPEKLMDCVTAVSGSGPAYAFMFIEALADAAVQFGMPRKQAYIYAAQTVKGAAAMVLEDGRCPGELKDAVCSPAGTTIEGVAALEQYGLRNAAMKAVAAAYHKSAAMGEE